MLMELVRGLGAALLISTVVIVFRVWHPSRAREKEERRRVVFLAEALGGRWTPKVPPAQEWLIEARFEGRPIELAISRINEKLPPTMTVQVLEPLPFEHGCFLSLDMPHPIVLHDAREDLWLVVHPERLEVASTERLAESEALFPLLPKDLHTRMKELGLSTLHLSKKGAELCCFPTPASPEEWDACRELLRKCVALTASIGLPRPR
jgi:hypothetical protein